MAFLYPRYFPEDFGCVEKTESDPADIRLTVNSIQFFPVGIPLEQAMALVWKSKKFYCSGFGQYPFEGCIPPAPPSSSIYTTESQSTSNTPEKMSELICPNSYDVFNSSFTFSQHAIYYKCSGGIEFEIDGENVFSFYPELGIYLYNNLYYLPVYYSFSPGTSLSEDFADRTYYAGDLYIDSIKFPLYAPQTDITGAIIKANYTCTTIEERTPE